jgi:hypothetical protein
MRWSAPSRGSLGSCRLQARARREQLPLRASGVRFTEDSAANWCSGGRWPGERLARAGAVLLDGFANASPTETGNVSNVEYSHYSLLATVETIFNLGTLARNDTSAATMSDMFRGGFP